MNKHLAVGKIHIITLNLLKTRIDREKETGIQHHLVGEFAFAALWPNVSSHR